MNIEIKFQGGKIWQEKTVAILAAFNQENRAKKGNLLLLLKGRLDQQVQQGQLEERGDRGNRPNWRRSCCKNNSNS